MCDTTLRAATSGALNFSPSDAPAMPKNIENTTICRISLLAIASVMLMGIVCDRNPFRLMPLTARPVSTASFGTARFNPAPGCWKVTITSPTRRIMPTVRVLNTNGAMTILINRRNRSVSSVILSAQAETVVGVA